MQKLFAENQFYFMNKTYGQYLKDFKLSDYDFSFEKKIISITGIRKRIQKNINLFIKYILPMQQKLLTAEQIKWLTN
ncbi:MULTISPECIES: hypothetical protein [Treponema]|uniref:Uncharacterized protein n=1 Tax=Treponema succinifaciens (strain ATCC 33096 / DSM 2489 / 6091) TaxID=869209 RepID=F2NW23_TRES6|nr:MULTISPECIES: hypothetical protein [Treponema]AEB14878.1 hypothetical protein Tresu_2005 [Treponema succinifaciens DSM 2489]MCI6913558.1 hypothetical protein [Treponema succinifaciens]MDD6962656.1 hypothetical protein [Treponema succinifaciens]MDY2615431.1 hypothetical protein [Treponema succinifaciens]MDY5117417.1 hypothetical protein [Treponema succinifaciens]